MSFDVHDLEQKGKENLSRAPRTRGALIALAAASLLMTAQARLHAQSLSDTLPDAPSALLFPASVATKANALRAEDQNASQSVPQNAPQNTQPLPPTLAAPATQTSPVILPTPGQPAPAAQTAPATPPPCPKLAHKERVPIIFLPSTQPSCQDPLQIIVETGNVSPLTSRQKGILATRVVVDPFNLLTIGFFSAIDIASNAHSAYGPGFAGWGKLSGYSFVEDVQGEFTGVFLIPSLVHEDPRYHRMPKAPITRRIEHALIHTVVSQHDDGSLMPNYATLINYPLSAEISNLYVPDVATDVRSTAERILAGYATDPVGPLVAEFLPDFAKRVHIHIIFAQQILNYIAPGSGEGSSF